MDDKNIVDLYWDRSKTAISETANKYGRYCRNIAFNILSNYADVEESKMILMLLCGIPDEEWHPFKLLLLHEYVINHMATILHRRNFQSCIE